MNIKFEFFLLRILFSAFFLFSCNVAEGQNVALNKRYTLSEKPNYILTEGSDDSDLTDGKKREGSRFWQNKSTVGWKGKHKINIDFDLEEIIGINSININTARNINAGVQYPANAFIFLSNDKKNYTYVGDVMADMDNIAGDYEVREFSLKSVNHKAKYVKIVVVANGNSAFLDEIEVLSNNTSYYQDLNESSMFTINRQKNKVDELINESNIAKQILSNIRKDLITLSAFEENNKKINKQLNNLNIESTHDLQEFHQQLRFIITDQLNKNLGYESFIIQTMKPWDQWRPFIITKSNDYLSENHLGFVALKASSQYGAFRIINTQTKRQKFTISTSCEDLTVKFYDVPNSPGITDIGLYDALLSLNKNEIILDAGEEKFIFFKMVPEQSCVSSIKIKGNNIQKEISIAIEVINDKQIAGSLNANVWAYLDYPIIKDNVLSVTDDLMKHHINTIVVRSEHLPYIGENDFSNLIKYLNNFKLKEGARILLASGFTNSKRRNSKNGELYLTPKWHQTFKDWYTRLLEELSNIGLNSNQVYWYAFDEIKEANIEEFIRISKWSKQEFPQLQLYVTINKEDCLKVVPYASVSQITPSVSKEAKMKYPESEIWQYTVISNSREKNPYSVYRLMAWKAFPDGYNGIGFWNYLSLNNNELNNYSTFVLDKDQDYAVVYTDSNKKIIPSRRWEAFSRGLEDYNVLQFYTKKYGIDRTKVLVKKVLDNISDTELADKVIKDMLQN